MNQQFIDLGLPSGTLWAAENEEGYFTFNEAVDKFGNSMPTKEQFEELIEHTDKYWDLQKKGILFVSKHNETKMFMPAFGFKYNQRDVWNYYKGGYYLCNTGDKNNPQDFHIGYNGLFFLNLEYLYFAFSVRLVSSK